MANESSGAEERRDGVVLGSDRLAGNGQKDAHRHSPASANRSWVGQRVFTHSDAEFSTRIPGVGAKDAITSGPTADLDLSSLQTYRVERSHGDWLWLQADDNAIAGWVQAQWIIRFDQALDFSTAQIRTQPQAFLHNNRGTIWSLMGDRDRAIADCTEAIRLDPSCVLALNGRGNAWSQKQEYERAIADCTEAIRLDPEFDYAFRNLAAAYAASGDFTRAVEWQKKANKLTSDEDFKRQGEERLRLFRGRKRADQE